MSHGDGGHVDDLFHRGAVLQDGNRLAETCQNRSGDWPYDKGQAAVYGPKGSLLATGDALLQRTVKSKVGTQNLDGEPVQVEPLPHEKSNPISYLVYCIRNDKSIENPLAAELNVGVVEILDAAKESIRTGKAVSLSAK